MALEISTKQLHRNAIKIGLGTVLVPILIIGITALLSSKAGQALTARSFYIRIGHNGIAQVSNHNDEPVLGNSLDSLGQSANQSLTLQSAAREVDNK